MLWFNFTWNLWLKWFAIWKINKFECSIVFDRFVSRRSWIINFVIIKDNFSFLCAKVIFTFAESFEIVSSFYVLTNDVDLSIVSGEFESIRLNIHQNLFETKLVAFYKHIHFWEIFYFPRFVLIRCWCLRKVIEMGNQTHILRISLIFLNHNHFIHTLPNVEYLITLVKGARFYLSETKKIFNIED
jgi:hypothetical protein